MTVDAARQAAIRLFHFIDAEVEEHKAFQNPVTMYLLARAKIEAADALHGLALVDPTNADTIRALQNRVQRQLETAEWLKEALDKGRESYLSLEEQERDELGAILRDDFETGAGAAYDD